MHDTALRLLAIGVGGGLGAIGRYAIGLFCAAVFGDRFAHGTLVVNVAGCFALGVLMHEAWLANDQQSSVWHVGLTVGLLGGLTTFSTFGYQTVRHLDAGPRAQGTPPEVAIEIGGIEFPRRVGESRRENEREQST